MGLTTVRSAVDRVVVLAPPEVADAIGQILSDASSATRIERVETGEALDKASAETAETSLLISFGTSIIVPPRVLRRFRAGAINFHAASPAYPGRDPHHFAAYDQCDRYGATAHVMTDRVDEGPILDVEEEPVAPGASPEHYLTIGRRCALRLAERMLPRIIAGGDWTTSRYGWNSRKTARRDFEALCEIDSLMDVEEIVRRVRVTDAPGYANAFVDLGGYRFRLEGPAPQRKRNFRHHEEDFTEANYEAFLDVAAQRYRFVGFEEASKIDKPSVLWRHDIDLSIHRAQKLSNLEARRGLKCTYFVLLGGGFYNPFEEGSKQRLRQIAADGHDFGLHFDPTVLGAKAQDRAAAEDQIAWEADVLRRLIDMPLTAVSIHNPDLPIPWLREERLAGLVNAYGATINDKFLYVSDSNGVWRHRRLKTVIEDDRPSFLQVLTHPAWWVPKPLPARARVRRAVEGRAKDVMGDYDLSLLRYGRPNIR